MKRYGPSRRGAQKRISGSKNFRSTPQKDFFNNICQKRKSLDCSVNPPNRLFGGRRACGRALLAGTRAAADGPETRTMWTKPRSLSAAHFSLRRFDRVRRERRRASGDGGATGQIRVTVEIVGGRS